MNKPSRTDEGDGHPGWNQSPNALAADLTTRSDLNGIANSRSHRSHRLEDAEQDSLELHTIANSPPQDEHSAKKHLRLPFSSSVRHGVSRLREKVLPAKGHSTTTGMNSNPTQRGWPDESTSEKTILAKTRSILARYAKFIGPGAMVSVAYIDPGNYATDIAAGATYRFKLLFMILLSNVFAIFLQSLCIKLGSVTGLNLAQMTRAHTPPWLNYLLYFFAEAAIIATDIAEVIGTAIALNLLFHIPLVAGCAISIVDVLVILFFYRPTGSVKGLRWFEAFVMALVLGVVICFCFQLSFIKHTSIGEVFKGYLPSSALVESKGLYQACGILGATVMPHSLYLGSGMVQPRLLEFDQKYAGSTYANTTLKTTAVPKNSNVSAMSDSASEVETFYRPSLRAIKSCLSYSITELAISLFTFALFVNSAILIIAGASLSETPEAQDADLFSIHALLQQQLSRAAGVIFALALLLSGISAGIVCTIAGQMVTEGQLSLQIKPWVRRLITRSIAITPSIIIAGSVGQAGLSTALEASQVALSIILPFVSAPLIWFTCFGNYMTVQVDTENEEERRSADVSASNVLRSVDTDESDGHDTVSNTGVHPTMAADFATPGQPSDENDVNQRPASLTGNQGASVVNMRNHWITSAFALVIWGVIVIMNVAAIVLLGLGID